MLNDAIRVYPTPKEKAANIKQHVAFYKVVPYRFPGMLRGADSLYACA